MTFHITFCKTISMSNIQMFQCLQNVYNLKTWIGTSGRWYLNCNGRTPYFHILTNCLLGNDTERHVK